MKILIKAKPSAKVEKVEELQPLSDSTNTIKSRLPTYKVSVKATPTDGRANDAIVRVLAKHFGIRPGDIRIVSGHTTNQKIVEINA